MDENEMIAELADLVGESQRAVAVTGAGVSVPCGIKGFDGMDFLTVLQMSSVTVLQRAPERYYRMARKAFLGPMFDNGPSLAHRKLAEMESAGKLAGIITTNIDNLHSIAGSQNVAEIQGSFAINKCLDCGTHYDDVTIWNEGAAPRCKKCGGLVGAFPVYEHLGLIDEEVQRARRWLSQADLVMFVGTNGPYSGAYMNHINPRATLVQINPSSTYFDDVCKMNIKDTADNVFALL